MPESAERKNNMRKALRIIALVAAVVCLIATVALGFIYFEDMLKKLNNIKSGFKSRFIIDDSEE